MGFKPTKAENDTWIKQVGDGYDYIVRYIDDLGINVLVFLTKILGFWTVFTKIVFTSFYMFFYSTTMYYSYFFLITYFLATIFWQQPRLRIYFNGNQYMFRRNPHFR